MAWRYVGSTTSPAAKTPLMLVRELRPSTAMVPASVIFRRVLDEFGPGIVADGHKDARYGSSDSVPSRRFFSFRPVTLSFPRTSSTAVFQTKLIFSCDCARSPMILDAFKVSRR